MDAHADPELDALPEVIGGKRPLGLKRRGDGVVGFGKGIEEGVSLVSTSMPSWNEKAVRRSLR